MADTPPRLLPPKKEVALALLEGESVFIHLDPRREGVAVPKGFAKQPQLVLQIGLNLAIRIPDLTIDEEGVSCTLSFNRSPFWCRMPWSAIYALVGPDGRGMLWPDDVPAEVAEQMRSGRAPARDSSAKDSPAGTRGEAKPARSAGAKRPRTRSAPSDAPPGEAREGDVASLDDAREAPKKPRPRPVLAAVPSPPPDRPAERAAARPPPVRRADAPLGAHDRGAQDRARGAHDRSRAGVAPLGGASAGGATDGKKAKRELPPYLRVVK